jgi:hypothetical protein
MTAGLVPAVNVFKKHRPHKVTTDDAAGPRMSPELYFVLTLAIKMAVAASFVITATVAAERAGPAIGALIATLPVSAGPAYVFLALDHDPQFISQAALASLALNASTAVYAVAYVLLAQRGQFLIAVPGAFLVWFVSVIVFTAISTTTWNAVLLNIVIFPLSFLIVRKYRYVRVPPIRLRWHDFVMRALLVACLVGAVVTLSFRIGPGPTGVLAAFPVVFTSIMIILHHRIGGPAAAAVLASGMLGLCGFGLAVLTLRLAAVPIGNWLALGCALMVAVTWNLSLYALRRRGIIH